MSGVLSACVDTHPDSHDGGGLQLGKDAFGCAEALLRAIDSRCVRVVPLFGDHTSDRMHDCVSLPCRALSFNLCMYPPACLPQVPQLWRKPPLSCSREGRPCRLGGVSMCSGVCLHMMKLTPTRTDTH